MTAYWSLTTVSDFNPRSLTGATTVDAELSSTSTFQSTLPHGSDIIEIHNVLQIIISIHAPSRERLYSRYLVYRDADFNPRSLTGATKLLKDILASLKYFNPRSLTGATGMTMVISRLTPFQSTLPHGSDKDKRLKDNIHVISIHAPSRERQAPVRQAYRSYIFQSTLPHGSDIWPKLLQCRRAISIHAPSRERLAHTRH